MTSYRPTEIQLLRDWIADTGVVVVMGDRLRLQDVAAYVDRSVGTVQNWIYYGELQSAPFNGRQYVKIGDLAECIRMKSTNHHD